MAKSPDSQPHFAPLQRVVGVPVTDPAELAAFEAMRRRYRLTHLMYDGDLLALPATAAAVLELARQLPPAEQHALLTPLFSALTPDGQLELLADMTAQLSAAQLQALQEQLCRRLGQRVPSAGVSP